VVKRSSLHQPRITRAGMGMAVSSMEWAPMDAHFMSKIADNDNEDLP